MVRQRIHTVGYGVQLRRVAATLSLPAAATNWHERQIVRKLNWEAGRTAKNSTKVWIRRP